ncbi:rRNA maturation RNase YbeY [Clostridiaceae bacterium HSG29]|nr:rRNA maturation RNase YbeY [Clostridiaceae bacterium HSG29]
MNILLNNHQNKVPVSNELMDLVKKSITAALNYENIFEKVEVSLLFIDNDEIRELNKEHRGVNLPTDVLSFPMYDDISKALDEEYLYLGDIVISCEKAIEQAKDFGHSVEREIGYLTVHSVLHLLGYDHMNEKDKAVMREKEEEILKKVDLER